MDHLEQRDAHDRLLQRGDPVDAPALGVALDEPVELRRAILDGVGQPRVKVDAPRSNRSSSSRPVRSCW
jgi:hypothetical protein